MHLARAAFRYCGRFAPSPTGPLHFGSLIAAVGSYLDARHHAGLWRLRIEDVDQPRCQAGASDDILRLLEAYGFEWDGEVIYQSRRTADYRAAFERLRAAGQVFPCACTRSELADSRIDRPESESESEPELASARLANDGARVYPGTCRDGLPAGRVPRAWRLRVGDARIHFADAVQGRIEQDLARDAGDFILLRADGLFAYQLAVVVDDAEQGISHVVRGADLLDSTPRQMLLQRLLNLPTPQYAHLPLAIDAGGEKLSKQTRARPLMRSQARPALFAALQFLGQAPSPDLRDASLGELWQWAIGHWSLSGVPRRNRLAADLPEAYSCSS
ncbi:tRNA glutamyl-Q(34) synthetase GluQRS [Sterolibacterium denitrificans]|nr:tRNA glutamyl-Q(34) synthetase GluQRS [Sterolibacterium denitrificans]